MGQLEINLPFWVAILTPRGASSESVSDTRRAYAFSTTSKLTQFLEPRWAAQWSVRLAADDAGIALIVADLQRENIPTLCFDPAPDASGGDHVSLDELLRQTRPRC